MTIAMPLPINEVVPGLLRVDLMDQIACVMWTESHGWLARARHPNAKYHAAPDRSFEGAVLAALAAVPSADTCEDLF